MQNYSYEQSSVDQYNEDKKIFPWNTNPYQINFELKREVPTPSCNNFQEQNQLSRSQLAHLRESPAARARRLARNAERMREKRARESDEERRRRLDKNALNNRLKRLNESPTEKAIRQVRDAARQRLRRAMESPDQRESRLRKLAHRMRMVRKLETNDKKAERLAKAAQRARERLQRETSEERRIRLQKGSEYARRVRSKKSTADSSSIPDTSDTSNQNTITSIYSNPSNDKCSTTDIQPIFTFDTEYSADSVEWYCDENIFAVGTYQLAENDNADSGNTKAIRKGRIYLFKFEISNQTQYNVEKLQQIESDAVLDQKWFCDKLVTATSLGNLETYRLENGGLEKIHKISLDEGSDCLVLSLDIDAQNNRFIASDSLGRLSLIDASSQEKILQWNCHEFEAWTCCFDRWNNHVVYSGGDDSIFNVWDVRCATKTNSKKRDAGVTSFLNHRENALFVGSYDENLCLYDLRNLKRTVDDINLSGGIWRIKKSPQNENILLVACMYHNFSVVDCFEKLTLIGEYNEHKSICYGCDWSYQNHNDYQFFAACSFYDHRLSVCSFTYEKK